MAGSSNTNTSPFDRKAHMNRTWSAKCHYMRENAKQQRRANPTGFPWFDPPGIKEPTGFAHLPEKIQVKILSYLPPDLHVTLRKEAGPTAWGSLDNVAVFLLNKEEWRLYEAQYAVSEGFRQLMNVTFNQEIASKRISIVLDMRNSVRSSEDHKNSDWYSLATVTNEPNINRVPALYLKQFLSLKIISPFLVGNHLRLFSASLTRRCAGHSVDLFVKPTWTLLKGVPNANIEAVYDAIQWKIYHPFTYGTDFGAFWTAADLAYFHDVLANIATKAVASNRPLLPGPSSMAKAMQAYREWKG